VVGEPNSERAATGSGGRRVWVLAQLSAQTRTTRASSAEPRWVETKAGRRAATGRLAARGAEVRQVCSISNWSLTMSADWDILLIQVRQLTLARTSGWGGRRKGAGRKPVGRPCVPHRARAVHRRTHPVSLTLRARSGLPSLRSPQLFAVVQECIAASAKDGFRVVECSVQRDHVHLLVEAEDPRRWSAACRGSASASLARSTASSAVAAPSGATATTLATWPARRRCATQSSTSCATSRNTSPAPLLGRTRAPRPPGSMASPGTRHSRRRKPPPLQSQRQSQSQRPRGQEGCVVGEPSSERAAAGSGGRRVSVLAQLSAQTRTTRASSA
jgi:hypothetical protein